MTEFRGRVAVVTGGASGIGKAMAARFAAEGMKIVLADVEPAALDEAARELAAAGAEVESVAADVSDPAAVEALAERTYSRFGDAHILCNNAGVASHPAPCWTQSASDWNWVLGVNLWGVIHGVRAFVPRMLASGQEGHVVNTASVAGLTTSPFLGPYHVSKHGVVALTECLEMELQAAQANVHASVLCPAWVRTRIVDSGRNRPSGMTASGTPGAVETQIRALVEAGLDPAVVAGHVLDAVRQRRFWILTHPDFNPFIAARSASILEGRNPDGSARLG